MADQIIIHEQTLVTTSEAVFLTHTLTAGGPLLVSDQTMGTTVPTDQTFSVNVGDE